MTTGKWSPSMTLFWELLEARLRIKLLEREIAELRARLGERNTDAV